MNRLSITSILILSLATTFYVGCGKEEEPAPLAPRKVYTLTTTEPSDTLIRSFSGQLNTSEGVKLAFEVAGRVTRVSAKQGQEYSAGTVLAELDKSDYQNNLTTAQANLTQAEQELRRLQRLFESGNASQSQLDSSIAAERSARANFNQSTKRLDDTTLKMPYQGTISSVSVDSQQVVNAGEPIMTVQGEGPMEFKFGVPTLIVRELTNNMPVSIRLGDIKDKEFPAIITEISPEIENNTTYGVTAAITVEDPLLRAGMDGEAILALKKENGGSVEVPLSCILSSPDGTQFLWIAEPSGSGKEATVKKRAVKLGLLVDEGQVAVESGLEPGERVITKGVHRVEEGMLVTLMEAS